MLSYNEIKPKKYIVYEDNPYEVISSHVFRKQQRKPVNQTKLKSLKTGKVIEITFHQADRIAEAKIEKREVKYIYNSRGEFWFSVKNNPSQRFSVPEEIVGPAGRFLKENSLIQVLLFNEKIIGVEVPIKIELKVVEAPPSIRGDTASGGGKPVKLETGAVITAPLFINAGDTVRVNTQTGEYAERV